MLIHRCDEPLGEREWWEFARRPLLGHLVAPGAGRLLPVVVPTQYVLTGTPEAPAVWLHLARANPIFEALEESPRLLLSLAGDWAFIPASWKAIGGEDPARGIPTTYYAAVQLSGEAEVVDDEAGKVELLRLQLATFQPGDGHVDPSEHVGQLPAIRGIKLAVSEVRAKFKYGGNVDEEHRAAVAARLEQRGLPGDEEARRHLLCRLGSLEPPGPPEGRNFSG